MTLESVDVGNFGVGVTLASIRVLDGAGTELFRQEDIALANSSQPALALSFGAGLTADLLRFEIDLAMLGARSDNVGIDNVRFSQIPRAPVSGVIPRPAGLPLLLGGLVLLGVVAARRGGPAAA